VESILVLSVSGYAVKFSGCLIKVADLEERGETKLYLVDRVVVVMG
jgi:hypothetical protein